MLRQLDEARGVQAAMSTAVAAAERTAASAQVRAPSFSTLPSAFFQLNRSVVSLESMTTALLPADLSAASVLNMHLYIPS